MKIKYLAVVLAVFFIVSCGDATDRAIWSLKYEFEKIEEEKSMEEFKAMISKLESMKDTAKDSRMIYTVDSLLSLKDSVYNVIKKDNVSLNKAGAYLRSKELITKALKSPSTAKFQSYNDVKVFYTENGEIYSLELWVDAQNSFGAMIRTSYYLKFSYLNEKWKLISIEEV